MPIITSPIPDQENYVGEDVSLDLNAYFELQVLSRREATQNIHQRGGDARMQIALSDPVAGENDLGTKAPRLHFPNLSTKALQRLTELSVTLESQEDIALLTTATEGETFRLECTFNSYVDADPQAATHHTMTADSIRTHRASDPFDGFNGPLVSFPKGFIPDTLGIKVYLPDTASPISKLIIQAN